VQGPKDITELRELLRPRPWPRDVPGELPKVHFIQTPSDTLRDRLYEAGRILFGLVPDSDFQQFAGNVLHDLCVLGEAEICRMHGIKAEHSALRVFTPPGVAPKAEEPPRRKRKADDAE